MEADDHLLSQTATTTTNLGFNLLPIDLIHSILLQLALPEIPRLGSVSKAFRAITSDPNFLHHYNLKFKNAPWLFIYIKRWGQDAVLKGITSGFDQWFSFSIKELVAPIIHRSHELYFLTSCGNFFLFAMNTSKELVCVNLMNKSVKKIPPSPLGPRDTSSWRRSGMKLVSQRSGGSDHFRFFFLECVLQNKMYLFEYDSVSEKWRSTDVKEYLAKCTVNADKMKQSSFIFLTVLTSQMEHVTLGIGLDEDMPLFIISPSSTYYPLRTVDAQDLIDAMNEPASNWMKIYGDGAMLKLKSLNLSLKERKQITVKIDLWTCLSSNGIDWHWEMISTVPKELLIMNPYGIMRGCLEMKNGMIRCVLMSNYEGSCEIIWLTYEMEKREWTLTLLPDCNMKEGNMGGIGFSSGLTLS